MEQKPILKMVNISKFFLQTKANQNINFELYPREICALLGGNGAGKTTLMNILFGLYRADEGKIYIKDKEVEIASPNEALKLGIGMVHQHFNLVTCHQVWENVILGTEPKLILTKSKACKEILKISKELGWNVNPEAYVSELSVGEKQRVEIIKVLFRGVNILILDEPTAVLTPQETDGLFNALKRLIDKGLSIIFISHKLREVLNIANRIVVLRQGRVVKSIETKEANEEKLAKMMVGDDKFYELKNEAKRHGKREILKLEKVWLKGDDAKSEKVKSLKDISFSIYDGEILGLAGVSGNGQAELVEVLTGMRSISEGTIYFKEKPIHQLVPKILIQLKWARIPEDRMKDGLLLDLSVAENLILEVHSDPKFSRGLFLDFKKIESYAQDLISKYEISPPLSNISVNNLSGGNMQKVILARELYLQPQLIILAQPTRGLDIKATNFVRSVILKEKEKGAAVLLVSEDLDEIFDLSDRIAVIYEGEIINIVERGEVNRSQIGLMMAGVRPKNL